MSWGNKSRGYDTDVGYRDSNGFYHLIYEAMGRINQLIIFKKLWDATYELQGLYDVVAFRIVRWDDKEEKDPDKKKFDLHKQVFDEKVTEIFTLLAKNDEESKKNSFYKVSELRRYLFYNIGRAGLIIPEIDKPPSDPNNAIEEGMFQ